MSSDNKRPPHKYPKRTATQYRRGPTGSQVQRLCLSATVYVCVKIKVRPGVFFFGGGTSSSSSKYWINCTNLFWFRFSSVISWLQSDEGDFSPLGEKIMLCQHYAHLPKRSIIVSSFVLLYGRCHLGILNLNRLLEIQIRWKFQTPPACLVVWLRGFQTVSYIVTIDRDP